MVCALGKHVDMVRMSCVAKKTVKFKNSIGLVHNIYTNTILLVFEYQLEYLRLVNFKVILPSYFIELKREKFGVE